MSRKQAILVNRLCGEAERLRAEVDELQAQLYLQAAGADDETLEDLWNVWPYSWAQSGWEKTHVFLAERLHSFHEKRSEKHLMHHDLKARETFGGAGHTEERTLSAA